MKVALAKSLDQTGEDRQQHLRDFLVLNVKDACCCCFLCLNSCLISFWIFHLDLNDRSNFDLEETQYHVNPVPDCGDGGNRDCCCCCSFERETLLICEVFFVVVDVVEGEDGHFLLIRDDLWGKSVL